jgi:dolichyl-phosphate-mannose--protein O-mannosyl transferase
MLRQRTQLLLILFALSAALHFYRLAEPRNVVFDEVHFGGFINDYHDGRLFFDIHPPHAKLIISGAAIAGGYRGEQDFKKLGTPITKASPALLRFVPAIAGTLIPLVLFSFLIQLGASPMAAFLGGLALVFDNALLIQTRLITLDGLLLLSMFGSLTCFLAAFRCHDRIRRTKLSLCAGLLAGLAPGIKITGLAALGLIGACLALNFIFRPSWQKLRVAASHSVWILTGAIPVYAMGWAIHFWLLNDASPGFHWPIPKGDFLADFVEINRTMFTANAGLRTAHPHSSPWWAWPLMARPIFYWSGGNSSLFFVGNPILWWGTTLGLLVVAANVVLAKVTNLRLRGAEKPWPPLLWVPALGYLISFAPLIPVQRPLFLYHYLSPLFFALTTVVLWLDHVGWTRPTGFRGQRLSFYLATGILVLGFIAMSPFTFSFIDMPDYRRQVIDFLPIWP